MNSATTQGQIQFIQNHQTALDAGEYQITVSQTVKIDGQAPQFDGKDEKPFETSLTFVIQGNRFGLQPQDIHAVFPPENSLGDHAHVLPHVALKSSTLPWERLVYPDAPQEIPWLALLLLHDDEKLLRTIQKEEFLKANFSDQQGKEITTDTKTKLWEHLLSNDVFWLRSIGNDEAIIVEKEARKSPELSDDFAVFGSPVEALLVPGKQKKLLRTIKKEYFSQFRFYDEQGKEITNATKEKLWEHLLSNDVFWLRSIDDDEAIIVEKEARKSPKLSDDFATFNNQTQALLTQGQREKLLRTIQKGDFFNAKFYDQQGKDVADETKTKLWQHLLSNNISWLRSIENDEAIIVEKEARESLQLSGDFAVFDSQVEALLAQFRDIKLITLEKLKAPSQDTIKWPGIRQIEIGQDMEKDQASVIDIPKKLLSQILPTTQELQYLAHVRQTTGGSESGEPLSIVVGNRLPKQNGTSTAYLVALENRYINSDTFDDQQATDSDYIRLVVLKSWSFACSDPEQDFKGLLKNLNVGTLKLPDLNNPDADGYLSQGYVPLPHYLRQGGKTFSWYHSPLLPGQNPTDLGLSQFAVRCADQLIAYNEKNGLFDISYAAAWQLGQLLALQDKKLAINLFNWKRANAQKLAKDNQQALYPHLFPADSPNAGGSISLPEDIDTWFKQLALLSGVPFNYLVPDDRMLPPESIRFFWLDWFWVESLLDGAFSIGRVHESNPEADTPPSGDEKITAKQITGCFIRSEVIAGWPDLQVDASASQKLKLLRRDRLSQDVLICFFEGAIQTLDISLKPEGLHFGFNTGSAQLSRKLRKLDGTEPKNGILEDNWILKSISWKDADQRIVNIGQLAEEIKEKLKKEELNSFTSAQFALQMVQGAELVRFHILPSPESKLDEK